MAGTHTYTEKTKRPNKCEIMRLRKCLHFSSLQKSDVYFKVLPYTEKKSMQRENNAKNTLDRLYCCLSENWKKNVANKLTRSF